MSPKSTWLDTHTTQLRNTLLEIGLTITDSQLSHKHPTTEPTSPHPAHHPPHRRSVQQPPPRRPCPSRRLLNSSR